RRSIDVCNIGRRSAITHRALLDRSDRLHTFYYYDTVAPSGANLKDRTFRVEDPAGHRLLLANMLKRSEFYLANRGHINRPTLTVCQNVISSRYYEGAAAGTIMLGEPPSTQQFRSQFDWPDAVIQVPFDAPDISDILDRLSDQPQRLGAIRRNNVREAALRHDWVYRVRAIFRALGVDATDGMEARMRKLERIAARAIGSDPIGEAK